MVARFEACVYGRSLAGIVGSNPPAGMDVCLLGILCVVQQTSWWRADNSPIGFLPNVVCLSECDIATS